VHELEPWKNAPPDAEEKLTVPDGGVFTPLFVSLTWALQVEGWPSAAPAGEQVTDTSLVRMPSSTATPQGNAARPVMKSFSTSVPSSRARPIEGSGNSSAQ
jgi:hypothetical protein